MWRGAGALAEPARFLAWACAILAHVAKDRARRDRIRAADPLPEIAAPDGGPSEGRRQAVLNAVAVLPEALRETVELFYFAGLTYREIGEAIGMSVPTVNLRLATARAQLREALKDEHE